MCSFWMIRTLGRALLCCWHHITTFLTQQGSNGNTNTQSTRSLCQHHLHTITVQSNHGTSQNLCPCQLLVLLALVVHQPTLFQQKALSLLLFSELVVFWLPSLGPSLLFLPFFLEFSSPFQLASLLSQLLCQLTLLPFFSFPLSFFPFPTSASLCLLSHFVSSLPSLSTNLDFPYQ